MYRRTKYRAVKTVVDNIKFDSKKESVRYLELKALEASGEIKSLSLQVPFVLLGKEKGLDGKTLREMKYIADFVYLDKNGKMHVEDVKGMKTDVYKIKKRLMWHIHGIAIEEV